MTNKIPIIMLLFFQLSHNPINSLNISMWTSWDTPCGIATYASHLYNAFINKNHKVQILPLGLNESQILHRVQKENSQIIIIQYHPGLFPNIKQLAKTCKKLKRLRKKIVMIMHEEPQNLKPLIRRTDFFIYHRKPGIQQKNKMVFLLPMGVPVCQLVESKKELKKKYEYNENDKILISLSLLHPFKKQDYIFAQLAPILKSNKEIKIQLIHPHSNTKNPNPMEKKIRKNIEELIINYQLENQVFFTTNYISQSELNERVYISDLGFQWFSPHYNRSTSATTKEYISAQTPLIIPDIPHFHDIPASCAKKISPNIDFFSEEIIKLLFNKKELAELALSLNALYEKTNYNKVINYYEATLNQLNN